MRGEWLAAFGLAIWVFQSPALADSGPQVMPGLYPGAKVSAAAPARAASPLGGGFLELMLTGTTRAPASFPSSAAASKPPAAYVGLYATSPAYAAPEARPAQEPPPEFRRQEVDYTSSEPPGAMIIDTNSKFLYLVESGGRAMRYGVGVGRPGFEWAGVKHVSRKAEWPDWTPPPEMLLRRPDLPRHMDGGPGNPLGARALYLGSSMYRIHGTNEPWTIGQNVSSGCIRMMNDDVTDLYERVKVGTKVTVM
jgi:lipoprotein-anchoring transpeptidase ErfK/SrfK